MPDGRPAMDYHLLVRLDQEVVVASIRRDRCRLRNLVVEPSKRVATIVKLRE